MNERPRYTVERVESYPWGRVQWCVWDNHNGCWAYDLGRWTTQAAAQRAADRAMATTCDGATKREGAERMTQLYVCEECGRLGDLPGGFADECRSGWHGRLHKVNSADASFDALLEVACLIVDRHYPAKVFDGSSGDPGAKLVVAVRECAAALSGGAP